MEEITYPGASATGHVLVLYATRVQSVEQVFCYLVSISIGRSFILPIIHPTSKHQQNQLIVTFNKSSLSLLLFYFMFFFHSQIYLDIASRAIVMQITFYTLVTLIILLQLRWKEAESRVLETCPRLFDALVDVSCSSSDRESRKRKTNNFLIVISYDGFRNEYLNRGVTPELLRFQASGVQAPYMKNVFPTKTFTNHHSISTGSYPEIHGVVGNQVYDKIKGKLSYGYDLFHFNRSALPIWTINEMAGGKSGCMMWPGSDYQYSGIKCSYLQNYSTEVPLTSRVDTVIEWLKHTDPPNLVMFYSEQPDKLAHVVGPDSDNVCFKFFCMLIFDLDYRYGGSFGYDNWLLPRTIGNSQSLQ